LVVGLLKEASSLFNYIMAGDIYKWRLIQERLSVTAINTGAAALG